MSKALGALLYRQNFNDVEKKNKDGRIFLLGSLYSAEFQALHVHKPTYT